MASAWRIKPNSSPTMVCYHSVPPYSIDVIMLPTIEVSKSWNTWNPMRVSRFNGALTSVHDTTPTRNGGPSLHLPGASGAFLGNVGSRSPVKNAPRPNVQTFPVNGMASFLFPAQSIHTTRPARVSPCLSTHPTASNNATSSTLCMV